jgi:tripartite-type tricarboxylate transporter receptor subunit TctC
MRPGVYLRSAVFALAFGVMLRPAAAQDFPARPITFMVAFAAGGYADSVARIIGARLAERIGQNVVIENRGGAGGNIAGAAVAHAAPDGYTLLVTTSSVAVNDAYYKNKVFSASDLKAVAIPGGAPETLSVKPDHPAKTLADLVKSAKGRSIDYASAGVGTSSHVAAAYFFKEFAKIDTVHVPFQGGAPSINAVMGGHVEVLVGTLPGYASQFHSGAMRPLAIASETRVPEFPDVPTYADAGYPGFSAETWIGVFAPARVDDAIATRLNKEINELIREPAIEAKLKKLSFQTRQRDLATANAYFRSQVVDWAKRVKAVGVFAE